MRRALDLKAERRLWCIPSLVAHPLNDQTIVGASFMMPSDERSNVRSPHSCSERTK